MIFAKRFQREGSALNNAPVVALVRSQADGREEHLTHLSIEQSYALASQLINAASDIRREQEEKAT